MSNKRSNASRVAGVSRTWLVKPFSKRLIVAELHPSSSANSLCVRFKALLRNSSLVMLLTYLMSLGRSQKKLCQDAVALAEVSGSNTAIKSR